MSECNTSRKACNGAKRKTLGEMEAEATVNEAKQRERERLEAYNRGLWSATSVQFTHPTPYTIELTADGQSVRFSAPTAEDCLRLARMYERDGDVDPDAATAMPDAMDVLGVGLKAMNDRAGSGAADGEGGREGVVGSPD